MTPCPPEDALGALVQHTLGAEESDRLRMHIDECDACAQVVIAAVRGGALSTGAAPTLVLGTPLLPFVAHLEPVAQIGRYELRGLLGTGGMGQVYEAFDTELERSIALKVLRPELALAETLTTRLVRESRLMAKVSHPAVITVHDVGREGDTVFIAMELVRGETLGCYVTRRRLPWRSVVDLYERAGAGLAAAHHAGVIHRDFKPDNVLVELTAEIPSRVVVTDFGIARATSTPADGGVAGTARPSDPRITATGAALGTPAYMAPEQLVGGVVDARADTFAFAASLWEALFGMRPFPGETIDEIREAMQRPPRAPHGGVPRRLVGALERGLAIDPRERWPAMSALLRELAAVRGRRRRNAVIAGVAGIACASVAASLWLATPAGVDPCARATLAYDAFGLRAAIADPVESAAISSQVTTIANTWRASHRATCRADRHPIQAPRTGACLEARKLELTTFVEDVIRDGGREARNMLELIGHPEQCREPAPGLLVAKVPTDPALRREVTALRYRAFAAQTARDRSDFAAALDEATRVAVAAERVWPLLHAEALYLLGTTQSFGGATTEAFATLRRAAAVAERAHHDYIAANSWIALVLGATIDEGTPARGHEYVAYADAALDRLGRPPLSTCLFEYAKGITLVELSRPAEAETALRRAIELAEQHALDTLPHAIQGLAYLYESQGRYADAVATYQRAFDKLLAADQGGSSAARTVREQLAANLLQLGRVDEAEPLARDAVRMAETQLPPENLDRALVRATLAGVYAEQGRYELALAEIRHTLREVAAIAGERSSRYGEAMAIEADLLSNLGRHAEAIHRYARACDIIAFHGGENGATAADCRLGHAIAASRGENKRAALHLVEAVHPMLVEVHGERHPQVAVGLALRGDLRRETGRLREAVADLEAAIDRLETVTLEPGFLAAAQFALARALWPSDRERARDLLASARHNFRRSSPSWAESRAEALAWQQADGSPARR